MTSLASVRPIAIVGMACRFPKGLNDLQALWTALQSRFSAIDQVPADRWTVDRYFSSNPTAKGKSYIRRGGFLTQDVRAFDANFFGISPRDAENMDPQQRVLLELVWEAFENSGMLLPTVAGKNVGVYVGGFMLDHMISQMAPANRSAINQNTAAGMMMTMLSNRISHTFDLRGPSLSIDTACSSSLVAFHYACQDLWHGNTEMAVVGGANIMLRPEYPMGMCKGQFLSRDGECKSFDNRGDGYGRGEGAGIVLLKPLDVAVANGDPILAHVLATGSNQDGHTPGISMPSREAQQTLIESICRRHGIDPASIEYVECHGTGTAVGDPIEAGAIGGTYGRARKQAGRAPVILGTIKSNTGHMEAAAGVAGIIKATLTLLYRETSPLANLIEVNPALEFDELHIRLSDRAIKLPQPPQAIRAAVNSFGYGGSNAHAILESSPSSQKALPSLSSNQLGRTVHRDLTEPASMTLPVYGRSKNAVKELALAYADLLEQSGPSERAAQDLVYTAIHHRAPLSHRAVIRASSAVELVARLRACAAGVDDNAVISGERPFQGIRLPVIVFTGMGPQWWAMGQELYRREPIYRSAVERADDLFQRISGFSILQEMLRDESTSRVHVTEFAQPANFLLQIGLWAVLRSQGVRAGAFVGHSVGELASAYAAGALTLNDALTVCFHRSRLQATCKGAGSMLAVGLGKDQIAPRLIPYADRVSIAAANGPSNVTIAGDSTAIESLVVEFSDEGIFNRLLQVEVPYHCSMMDPILDDLRQSLASIQPTAPLHTLYSTVTGSRVDGISFDADYWPKNVRQPVEFALAIQNLLSEGYCTFLEVGPHPVLASSIEDCVRQAGKDGRLTHTLRRQHNEVDALHRSVLSLIAAGCELDWSKITPAGNRIGLPNYQWQREVMWVENERAMLDRIAPITYPMLGIQDATAAPVYRVDFDHEPMSYLREHVVSGLPVLPAAGYVEAMLELASLEFESASTLAVRDLEILAPMIITPDRGLDCVTFFESRCSSATIRSLENGRIGEGQVHVTAKLAALPTSIAESLSLSEQRALHQLPVDVANFYQELDKIGLQYGPAFQTIRELYRDTTGRKTLARIELSDQGRWNRDLYLLHPTMLDACLQALMPMLGNSDTTYLPTGFDELCLYRRTTPDAFWSIAESVNRSERQIRCDLKLVDDQGEIFGVVRGIRLSAAERKERRDRFGDRVKRQILRYEWGYGSQLAEPKRLGHWLIVGNPQPLAATVCQGISAFGACISGVIHIGENPGFAEGVHTVRFNSPVDFASVLDQVGELDGIVCLHGLEATTDSADPVAERALETLVSLTQALLKRSSSRTPRIYVVTQSAHQTTESDAMVQPSQTAINGFVRVAYNELDGLRFSSVDLPAQLDQRSVDSLILELLCDDEQDEVAIRGGSRMQSTLGESVVLFTDCVIRLNLRDDQPVAIRPLRQDIESVGTARLLSAPVAELQSDEVRVRVRSMLFPSDLVFNAESTSIALPFVEFTGEVIEISSEIVDLEPGMQVCGFAPADVASHLTGKRRDFLVIETHEPINDEKILAGLSIGARARYLADSLSVSDIGQSILIECSPLGQLLANCLLEHGWCVSMLTRLGDRSPTLNNRCKYFDYSPEGIAKAVAEQTEGCGFSAVAVHCGQHQQHFGWHLLASHGTVIDLDDHPSEVLLPRSAGGLLRSDIAALCARRRQCERALTSAIATIIRGEFDFDLPPVLSITLADIAWQKLPLTDANTSLVLSFDTEGSDLPVVQSDQIQFHADATYLITGGLGGFGRKTAEWLIDHGARNLVLTSRTGADSHERQAFVAKLEQMGAKVLVPACDTADIDALSTLFDHIASCMPPLKGIFHSGAVIQDEAIPDITFNTFEQVLRSKALGAWNLHLLSRSLKLDHFVLYSSIANLVGNSRQAAYSAANGFLNGLAWYRRKLGYPGTSVNWGAIADVGVVANDEKLEQFLRYTGLRGIESSECLQLLGIGLRRDVAQFGVTLITSWAEWARFETRGARSPRFTALIQADSVGKDDSTRQALLAELNTLTATEQVDLLSTLIVDVVAHVTKAAPDDVSVDRSISQLGVDSLMATEIQMTLDSKLGLQVSVLELIGDSTIRGLATNSLKKLMSLSA